MKTRRSLIVISALLAMAAIPATCFATPPAQGGGYMSFFAGVSAPQDSTITTSQFNPVAIRESRVQFDPGINIGGTGGYDFGYVRVEGEMSYKQGEVTSIADQFGTRYVNTDGQIGAFAMMTNTFFDIHNDSPITPYVGGGIGFATVMVDNTRGVDANTGAINFHVLRSDEETTFAYQVGGGAEIFLNRRLSLDLGYRYFGTSKATFKTNWPNTTELRLNSHNGAVGLRIKF